MAREFARPLYNSRAWKAVRRAVLTRDQFTCQLCGGRATEVHHKIELAPGNIGRPEVALDPGNLVSLCSECHKNVTNREHHPNSGDIRRGYVFDATGQVVPPPGGIAK